MKFPAIIFSEIIKQKIPGLKLGLLSATKIRVKKKSVIVDAEFEKLDRFINEKFKSIPPSADEVVSAVRRMYRRIGWEPTRYRPSSEAMIRRFIKNIGLYRINNLVDLGNVASAHFHLPMGLYDLEKIKGEICIDVGGEEESYQGISKEIIHATGKLILRDEISIFGNPTADSQRTCISPETKNALALFFTPPEIDDAYLNETLSFLKKLYQSESSEVEVQLSIQRT